MKLQKLLSLTRQAIDEYGMIQENDKIAVGISGGKDSLTLLYALSCLRKFYPHKFDIVAVTVDLGFDNLNLKRRLQRLSFTFVRKAIPVLFVQKCVKVH